jgi:hypothetical protein
MYTFFKCFCEFPEQHATAGDEELTSQTLAEAGIVCLPPGLPPRVGTGSAHGPPECSVFESRKVSREQYVLLFLMFLYSRGAEVESFCDPPN